MKTKESAIKTTHETNTLKCMLTDEEIREASDALARNLDELDTLDDEKTKIVSDFKAQIEAKEAAIRVQKNLVRDKYAFRPVRCTLTLYYTENKAILVRDDTGEILKERPLNEEEKQMSIGFDSLEKQ